MTINAIMNDKTMARRTKWSTWNSNIVMSITPEENGSINSWLKRNLNKIDTLKVQRFILNNKTIHIDKILKDKNLFCIFFKTNESKALICSKVKDPELIKHIPPGQKTIFPLLIKSTLVDNKKEFSLVD